MTTLIKIIIISILSLMLFSCDFNIMSGVQGNGNVITKTRFLNESFSGIKAAEGLEVYITQSHDEQINIEADENLHNLILTEVKDGVLKIHVKESIGRATSKKVHVNFKNISKISSSSGSHIYSVNTIATENLNIKSSNGSHIKLNVNTTRLTCSSSSGSYLKVSGNTNQLTGTASSGSNIKAGELVTQSSQVNASSGANITVNTSKKLIASASSGADINYYENPKSIDKNKSSGGSIRKK